MAINCLLDLPSILSHQSPLFLSTRVVLKYLSNRSFLIITKTLSLLYYLHMFVQKMCTCAHPCSHASGFLSSYGQNPSPHCAPSQSILGVSMTASSTWWSPSWTSAIRWAWSTNLCHNRHPITFSVCIRSCDMWVARRIEWRCIG